MLLPSRENLWRLDKTQAPLTVTNYFTDISFFIFYGWTPCCHASSFQDPNLSEDYITLIITSTNVHFEFAKSR